MTAPRTHAYRALRQILEAGQMMDEALVDARLADLPARDRAFTHALVMAVLRDYGRLKKLMWPMLRDPNAMPPEIWAMLLLGAVQLLVLRTPPHAAVNTTIELAKRENMAGFKGLLNAVLRRVSRDGREKFLALPIADNFPPWLLDSWKIYADPDTWLENLLTEPALDITAVHDTDVWAQKLGGEKIAAHTIRMTESADVTKLPGYDDGAWWVQDVAATQPVLMLGDIAGQDILELCAAPGGKTMQLCAAGARVTAVDSSDRRLVRLQENLSRTQQRADVQCADVLSFDPGRVFNTVVLDAPCSATGTIRRHPEILLHRRADDVVRLARLQSQMLGRASAWVKPGGRLLYCVCSLQHIEGEQQVETFLVAHPQFKLVEQKRILPNAYAGGNDGFFVALLKNN